MNAEANPYIQLVERFCNICYGGNLPSCSDEVLVGAIVLTVGNGAEWKDQPQPVIDAFERGITDAVRDVRERLTLARRIGHAGSPWTN
jgi:tartrate dehydratase alpha subunit/fumarate hydratase class I-like protein